MHQTLLNCWRGSFRQNYFFGSVQVASVREYQRDPQCGNSQVLVALVSQVIKVLSEVCRFIPRQRPSRPTFLVLSPWRPKWLR